MFWTYVSLKIVSPLELHTTSRILPIVNTRVQSRSAIRDWDTRWALENFEPLQTMMEFTYRTLWLHTVTRRSTDKYVTDRTHGGPRPRNHRAFAGPSQTSLDLNSNCQWNHRQTKQTLFFLVGRKRRKRSRWSGQEGDFVKGEHQRSTYMINDTYLPGLKRTYALPIK